MKMTTKTSICFQCQQRYCRNTRDC